MGQTQRTAASVPAQVRYLIGGLIAVLVGIAGVVALFSGPIPTTIATAVTAVLPPVPETTIRGVVAGLLVVLGGYYFWEGREAPDRWDPLVDGHAPERPRNAPQRIGDAFMTETDDARLDVRFEGADYETTSPHRQLRSTASRAIQRARHCSAETAAEILEQGTWTDDPVAAAFLSTECEFPYRYHVFTWARPGAAYERAVERTGAAIGQFVYEELPTRAAPTDRGGDTASLPETTANWFERDDKTVGAAPTQTSTELDDNRDEDGHGSRTEQDTVRDHAGGEGSPTNEQRDNDAVDTSTAGIDIDGRDGETDDE